MADKKISEILWERLIITEQINAIPANTPTSGVKSKYPKKKKFRSNRDSLAFRESPGKPGSKRFNRYMNNKFLKDGGVLKDRFEAEMDHNVYQRNEKLIYQDRDMKYEWEPYRNITFELQEELLKDCQPSLTDRDQKKRRQYSKSMPINQSFSMLQKSIREAFKKPFIQNSSFIATAEQQMIQFIENPYIQTTEVELDSSHHRLLLHGIGSYYSVLTKSYTNSSGKRITTIRKPKVMPSLPELTISEYILQEQIMNKNQRIKVPSPSRSRSNSFQGVRIRC